MTRLVSPLAILSVAWAATLLVAGWALGSADQMTLLPELLWREHIDLLAFSWMGAAWLIVAFVLYATADQATALQLRQSRPTTNAIAPKRLARIVAVANAAILIVLVLWIALTARTVGGFSGLVTLTEEDPLAARDALLAGKLFPGMRLIYAGLSATGALAVALLPKSPKICWAIIAVNALVLLVLPLVMSQRLLLLHYICALVITDVMLHRRARGLGVLAIGAGAFLAVWLGREALTNTSLTGSALSIGLQKLAFYAVNDLWNGFAPLHRTIEHTWGGISLHALAVLTATDPWLDGILAARFSALDTVRGGGEFPLFTAAYVDFGALGGGLFLVCLAIALRVLWWRASAGPVQAALYAQFAAALTLAPHAPYVLHQNVQFSAMLILGLAALAQWRSAAIPFHSVRHNAAR